MLDHRDRRGPLKLLVIDQRTGQRNTDVGGLGNGDREVRPGFDGAERVTPGGWTRVQPRAEEWSRTSVARSSSPAAMRPSHASAIEGRFRWPPEEPACSVGLNVEHCHRLVKQRRATMVPLPVAASHSTNSAGLDSTRFR